MTSDSQQGGLEAAALTGVRWISIVRIVGEVVAFASMVVLARLIGPSEFGEFAIAAIAVEIVLTITGGGIGVPLVQRESVGREHLQTGLFISICIGLVLAVVAFVTAPLIFTPLFGSGTAELVRLATPMFLIFAVIAVPEAVAQRRLDFRLIGIVQLLSLVVRASIAVALALAGFEAEALILGWMAAAACMLIVLLVFAPVPWPRFHRSAARELVGFGLPSALSALGLTGFRNVDYAIVGARLGTFDAGLYWRGYQLGIEYQRKVGYAVHQVAFPLYSRSPGVEALFELRRRIVRLVSALLLPALAGLVVLAPVLVPWLFGAAWTPAVVPTQILAVAGMATVAGDTVGAAILAAGRPRAWLGFTLSLFAAYALTMYVAAGYGLNAVCVAVVAMQVLSTVTAYGVLFRGLVERPLARLVEDVAPGIAAAAAVGLVTTPIVWALSGVDAPPVATLGAAVVAGAIAGLLTLRLVSRSLWGDLSRLGQRVLGGRRAAGERTPAPLVGAE